MEKVYSLEEVKKALAVFIDSFYNGVIDLPIDEENQKAIDELFNKVNSEIADITSFEFVKE